MANTVIQKNGTHKRQERYAAFREAKLQEELSRPADINLYDIAKADLDSQSKKLE